MSALPTPVLTFEQQVKLAESFAKSGLFGVKTADQALALMALCESEGLHPAKAVQEYHIIQGRPAMKSEAMLARFLRAGGTVEWHARTESIADATFSHPAGGKVRVNWTIEMARAAGLATKDVWKAYPRALLSARCVSEGTRAVWPAATGHVYTPEEIRDMEPILGEVTGASVIAGEARRRDEWRDVFVGKFMDAIVIDQGKDDQEIAQDIKSLHDELNKDQDLYRAVWAKLDSSDRAAIKKYIELARNGSGKEEVKKLEGFFAEEEVNV